MNLTSKEKADLLKNAIFQMYSKEGHSISYISKVLEINRKTLSEKIKEWNIPLAEPKRHLKPSNKKFMNKHKLTIISRLNHDVSISDIAKEIKCDRRMIQLFAENDKDIKEAYESYHERTHLNHANRNEIQKNNSYLNYNFEEYKDEEWKPILGYEEYYISNYGRVKKYSKQYKSFHLNTLCENKNTKRLYIALYKNGKHQNLQISRLVGFNFVDGYSAENNTINHKDGNIQNNYYKNLEWVSQSSNNKHSYSNLNRQKVRKNSSDFDKVIYDGKYEFKTVAALSRFLNKSETQVRRYLKNPEKHKLEIIK